MGHIALGPIPAGLGDYWAELWLNKAGQVINGVHIFPFFKNTLKLGVVCTLLMFAS